MSMRRAMRRHFGRQIAAAPYQAPPGREGEAERPRGWAEMAWPLAAAAVLALMVLVPTAAGSRMGSVTLGAYATRTLETGAVRELGRVVGQAVQWAKPLTPAPLPHP